MKEKFNKELEKIKGMPLKKKIEYIWGYYKIPILAIIFGAILIVMFVKDYKQHNPDAVNIALCDMLPVTFLTDDESASEIKLNESYIKYAKLEPQKQPPLTVDTSYSFKVADGYLSMMMRQKLVASLSSQIIDVMVADENYMREYGKLNTFLDVREYLPEKTISELDEKGLICKVMITPTEEDIAAGMKPFEVYYGIKADRIRALSDAGYITDRSVVSLIGNPDRIDQAKILINMFIDSIQ